VTAQPAAYRTRGLPSRRRRLLRLIPVGLVAIALVWFLVALFQPFAGSGHGSVDVTIPRGAGVGKIGDVLATKGVVSNGFLFEIRTTLAGRRGDLKPGAYLLKRDMSYGAAIDALVKGPGSTLVSVTIPEGLSRREIAARLTPVDLSGSYLRATESSPLLDPRRYGAKGQRDLEGFLFPSTYQIRRGGPVKTVVAKQLGAFELEIGKVNMRAARHVNLTTFDVVTIASLIEREARVPSERRLVASVIYNRLKAHMQLQIDASVRFATGNWSSPLTRAQLHTRSPYNTYLHRGLPPGPIDNPGLASLQAAAHAAHTHFLYYVVKPGTCGRHAFSASYAQFLRDSKRYNAARAASGGRSPEHC